MPGWKTLHGAHVYIGNGGEVHAGRAAIESYHQSLVGGGSAADTAPAKEFPPVAPKEEAEAWAKEQYGQWGKSRGYDELEAIKAYVNDSAAVNPYLWGDPLYTKDEGTPRGNQTIARINALDRAIDRAPRLNKDVTVIRGYRVPQLSEAHDNGTLVGMEWTDKGFTSTTLDPGIINGHSKNFIPASITAEIRLPKGTKAAYVSSAKGVSKIFQQSELLIARNQRYRVVSVSGTKNNRHMVVELLQD